MMKGTPYIYQGEELGMTNYPFEKLEDCIDVEVFNNYKMLVLEKKVLTHEQMMNGICYSSRDNARTPMQWDNSTYAGFSKTHPWMNVNPNYHDINALSQINNNDSIYSFYQKLIQLRHEYDVIVYGDFELLEKEHPHLFIYRRYDDKDEILVISNFTNQELTYEFNYQNYEILLSNDKPVLSNTFYIKAYGTYILNRVEE